MALSIEALGAVTTVGPDVPSTMGSIYTQFQLFDELDLETVDGEKVTGGRIPLAGALRGPGRLSALALLALEEAAASAPPDIPTPVFLCLPEAIDLAVRPGEILDRVVAEGVVLLDRSRARRSPLGAAA